MKRFSTSNVKQRKLTDNQRRWILKYVSEHAFRNALELIKYDNVDLIKIWMDNADECASGSCKGSKLQFYNPILRISPNHDVVPKCQCEFTNFKSPWCKHAIAMLVLYCLCTKPNVKLHEKKKRSEPRLSGFITNDGDDGLDPNDDYVPEEDEIL